MSINSEQVIRTEKKVFREGLSTRKRKNTKSLSIWLSHIALVFVSFVTLFPIALMVINSFKSNADITSNPLALPSDIAWSNFSNAWNYAHFSSTIPNSIMVALYTISIVLVLATPLAWVLARKLVRSWQMIMLWLMAVMTVPSQLFMFVLYFTYAELNILNNQLSLALIYAVTQIPFATFILRTYFAAIPVELEESAQIEGASPWQVLRRVLIPMVAPGLLTVSLIVGLGAWNEFLLSSIFMQGTEKSSAIVAFFSLQGTYGNDSGILMAGAMILIAPVIFFFVLLQKRFVEGLVGGSVKG
ncbi:carbohydrate ABC transporter permease [Vibrio lamellibrachiae]|uniref:carbohydrate ABC transporter permease n=1 Tax=Vibrio lamellibrachiae TaxID=2910253 RepID=UPI003D0FB55A